MAGNLPPGIGKLSFENNKGGGGRGEGEERVEIIFYFHSVFYVRV